MAGKVPLPRLRASLGATSRADVLPGMLQSLRGLDQLSGTGGHTRAIELVRLAFEQRQADAVERAQALRRKLLAGARDHARQRRQAEQALPAGLHRAYHNPDGRHLLAETGNVAAAIAHHTRQAELMVAEIVVLDAILDRHGQKNLREPGTGPTTEALAQIRRDRGDPVDRLWVAEEIDDNQAKWAREIASIHYNITRALSAKTSRLMTRPAPESEDQAKLRRANRIGTAEWMLLLHGFVYLPWAWRRSRDVRIALALAVEQRSPSSVAREHGKRRAWVVERLRRALDGYGATRHRFLKFGPHATRDLKPAQRGKRP